MWLCVPIWNFSDVYDCVISMSIIVYRCICLWVCVCLWLCICLWMCDVHDCVYVCDWFYVCVSVYECDQNCRTVKVNDENWIASWPVWISTYRKITWNCLFTFWCDIPAVVATAYRWSPHAIGRCACQDKCLLRTALGKPGFHCKSTVSYVWLHFDCDFDQSVSWSLLTANVTKIVTATHIEWVVFPFVGLAVILSWPVYFSIVQ